LDAAGKARMVDVSGKDTTVRTATASAVVTLSPEVFRLVADGKLPKGDVGAVARIAGIQAAKRTAELIPMCHPIGLDAVEVDVTLVSPNTVRITAVARVAAKTGVEMEALTAVGVAALTVYDMCKSADKGITIGPIRLEAKTGGKSGNYRRDGDA
jgi:cyclic pyranopterin phosphate synthase